MFAQIRDYYKRVVQTPKRRNNEPEYNSRRRIILNNEIHA